MFDDFRDVTDLKTSDAVLVYGGLFNFGMNAPQVQTVRRGSELTKLARENVMFTRIYVEADVDVSSPASIAKLTSMNAGLLSFFVKDEEHEKAVVEYFDKNYPWHEHWEFNTSSGRVVVTKAHGAPEWMD